AVAAATEQLAANAHAPRARIVDVALAPRRMALAHAARHEDLDALPDQLVARVAEQRFAFAVHEADPAVGRAHQQRDGRRLDEHLEQRRRRAATGTERVAAAHGDARAPRRARTTKPPGAKAL